MNKKFFICFLFFSLMYTIYCSEYTTILKNKLTSLSDQGITSIDKKTVLKFDKDGYLSSVISDDINITINHKGASYDLFFQDNEESWHQRMVHEDDCWRWFNDNKLICNIYYSNSKKYINSDSTNYTIEMQTINNQIIINLGTGRKFVLDMNTKNTPVFNNSREISKLKRINNIYTFTDYFDVCYTNYRIENPPFYLDYSQIAFLVPVLFHIDYNFYPFITSLINQCYDSVYHSTSYLTESTTTYEPEHLQRKDGLPWASGNGKGIGDIISIKEFEHENPETLIIMNGYQDANHPDYYGKNSRVKALKITNRQTKKSKTIAVSDTKEEQRFSLKELGKGGEYELEILDVYNGSKYDDLCIQYLVVE